MLNLATESLYWRYENQELADPDLVTNLTRSICTECDLHFPNAKLEIVLSEIVTNAIDHGVLGLRSDIKDSPKGFEAYLRERDRLIKSLENGWVSITVQVLNNKNIQISVVDSGHGFEYSTTPVQNVAAHDLSLHGRGLLIVSSLCVSMSHAGDGNCIVVEVDASIEEQAVAEA